MQLDVGPPPPFEIVICSCSCMETKIEHNAYKPFAPLMFPFMPDISLLLWQAIRELRGQPQDLLKYLRFRACIHKQTSKETNHVFLERLNWQAKLFGANLSWHTPEIHDDETQPMLQHHESENGGSDWGH